MSKAKVSIIMPSLNVVSYIKQCIESAINQTLQDIEIICVDAGSTDGTLEIIQSYANIDSRIKIIISDKKSYGYQMNLGLDAATGDYIGILETDDWAKSNMFEVLWNAAIEHDADMVKANYFWYTAKNGIQDKPFENLNVCTYNEVFSPLVERAIFTTTPAIWSGIYRRDMLLMNQIRFNETPGASFQDTSFHFMVCTVSRRCYLLKDHFLHYRRDNDASSVYSESKVYCVADEMHYYEQFLEKKGKYKIQMETFFQTLKYEKYRWNYERLIPKYQYVFLKLMHDEFASAFDAGKLDENQFEPVQWKSLNEIIKTPLRYFENTCKSYSTRLLLDTKDSYTILKQAENKTPKVSVIIPAYNYEKYVGKAIESVLNQTLTDIEIICIDDGSTDGTLNILLDYAARDSRITVCTQTNKGQSGTRNVGLSIATGEYIDFLDSDDQLASEALEKLYQQAKANDLDILYYDGTSVYETAKLEKKFPYYLHSYEYHRTLPDVLTGAQLFSTMKEDNKFRASVCFSLYRKTYLDSQNARFVEGILQEDHIFSTKYLINAKRVAHSEEKYYLRTVHDDSVMTQVTTFKHFYGYLTCVIELLTFASQLTYDEPLYKQISSEIQHLINMTKKSYENLPNKKLCLSKLNSLENLYFSQIVLSKNNFGGPSAEELLLKKSRSYKIGRMITWIPRKVRGFFWCCKDHGIKYTLKRALYHLHIR